MQPIYAKPSRRLLVVALFAALSNPLQAENESGSRPNILLMMLDDMGYAEPGFNGGKRNLTPNIDRLAVEGMRLTQFYTHSVSTPTRAAMLTGRYAFRTWCDWRPEDFGKPNCLKKLGLSLPAKKDGEVTQRVHGLATSERTIAEALREAGYFTAIMGKWHCGEWLKEQLPMQQGFAHQYGHYGRQINHNTKFIHHSGQLRAATYDWHRNEQPLRENGYTTDLIAAEVERVLGKQTDYQPFFIYVSFQATPDLAHEVPRYAEDYDAQDAALKCLDEAIGRILAALGKNKLEKNTLVIFTGANGGVTAESNRPFRGTKDTTFEGGVRVPCIMRWPEHTRAGSTNDLLMHITDFFPTFANLASASQEQKKPLDGIDQTNALFADEMPLRSEIIFEVAGSIRTPTIRSGDYKLISDLRRDSDREELLFDIAKDPSEKRNIASAHPGIVQYLRRRLIAVSRQRPPSDSIPVMLRPAFPHVLGAEENTNPPKWIKKLSNE